MTTATTITLANSGDSCYIRGILSSNNTISNYTQFKMIGKIAASGNSNYLWNYKKPDMPLKRFCGYCMFDGCTSLTTAPELPATTLTEWCYCCMFHRCTSLTTAPELPATALTSGCYSQMFQGCTSLTTAPELPATTLVSMCYESMFRECTSLTTAPELPATTLVSMCYESMFRECTSLTTAPELPATELVEWCYSYMFQDCSSLNYIKCLAINGVNQIYSTYKWVSGVQTNSGTFVKHPLTPSFEIGANGTPYNWTVEDVKVQIDNYITFTALENNVPISLNRISRNQKLLYSTDDGETWNNFTTGTTITLENSGDTCYVAGMISANNNGSNYTHFNLPNRVSVSGNINSLWNHENLNQNLYSYCGYYLFYNCTGLVDASELTLGTSATTLASGCYNSMFNGCSSLTTAPELPATTLASDCYQGMFYGCSSLTTAPELPATTLANYCYSYMFYSCSNLNYIKCLATDISASNCTSNWVNDVAQTGTFVKAVNMDGWTTGANGIPTNWAVEDTQ